jgi:CheY-like chemotaxis protein
MPKVVLIVDDDAAVLETAILLVESLGYRAEAAANPHDALRRVKAEDLDAVFTDVVMPGMNGYQLAKRIHAVKPDLPVICATGYANVAEDPEHCDVLLRKPYDTATLARALAQVIPGEIGA